MNDELNIDVKTLNPFRRFIYTIGALPSSYLISMTYEEQLVWFCNYLEKTVIPTINNNGLAVEELQAKYIELKSYVNNYFENLDVQEEINNKLDDMAESGELADIIAQYLSLAGLLVYNTVDDLKGADNVAIGSICKTLGFNSANDGGASYYKIREVLNSDTVDEKAIISITGSETLIAEFMSLNKKVNPFQFGAYGDGTHDDTSVLQYTLNYANTNKLEVYIPTPSSYFKITSGLTVGTNVAGIIAEKYDYNGIIRPTGSSYTVLTINADVGFYMKNVSIGNTESVDVNGILFSGDVGLNNFEHIRVYNLNGYGFKINNMWDSVLTDISIEKCGNSSEYAFSMNCVNDDTTNMTLINRLQVEQADTKAIYIDPGCLSCTFNDIHSERASVTAGTYCWYLGGSSCSYNGVRLQAEDLETATICSYINSANNEYNTIRVEEYIKTIYECGSGSNGLINAGQFDYLEEKTDQTGLVEFNNCMINDITLKTRTHLNDCKITTVTVDWTSASDFPSMYNCTIGTLTRSNNDARYWCENCKIASMYTDSVRDMYLVNCIVTAIRENKISYSAGTFINTTFNTTTNIDYAEVYFINCKINGNTDLLYGTQPYSFINTKVSGTVGASFGAVPTTSPAKGTRTDNMIPSSGQPSGWVYSGSAWLSLGNLS